MIILSITITNEYKLKINEEQLNPTVQFDNNEIYFFKSTQEKENTMSFLKEWIENPDEYKEYEITYQGQTYSLTAEVLFALISHQNRFLVEIKNEEYDIQYV